MEGNVNHLQVIKLHLPKLCLKSGIVMITRRRWFGFRPHVRPAAVAFILLIYLPVKRDLCSNVKAILAEFHALF